MVKSDGTVLLTGVTGFVGGAIAFELLVNTDADLVCLVRPRENSSADARLLESLHAAADMYGTTLTDAQLARCRAVSGDMTMPTCGVEPGELTDITECWHVAASLAFEDERAEEIALHNVQGTRNVVELADKTGCTVFNHVSTAYVAGGRRGVIREKVVAGSTTPNNQYERTKIAAEAIVREAGFATTRIFRPSIVIGHSKTFKATTFTGLYGLVKVLHRAREAAPLLMHDQLQVRPIRLRADANTPLNTIPVDYVARGAVTIAAKSNASDIYHLTNDTPLRFAQWCDGVAKTLGIRRPLLVSDCEGFHLVDQEVDSRTVFYQPYMSDEKYFDTSNSTAILGDGALACAFDADDVANYVGWYVGYREAMRQKEPALG